MLAEANMALGWLPEYSLKMNARRFFSIMQGARSVQFRKDSFHRYELVKIAMCAQADKDWINRLLKYHYDRSKVPEMRHEAPPEKFMTNKEAFYKFSRITGS